MAQNKQHGDYGENLATEFLTQKGLKIIKTNFRCFAGEIDIICRDGSYTVFVEVKLRRGLGKGYPREAVGYGKQQKIRKAAMSFLTFYDMWQTDIRFDVIEILHMDTVTIEHIENAF